MPFPSTIAKSGTVRKRFAVVSSGMMGGGFSEESADADCGAVAAVATAKGAMRAVWRMCLLLLECKEDKAFSSDEIDA